MTGAAAKQLRIDGVRWEVDAAFAQSAAFRSLAAASPRWQPRDLRNLSTRRRRWSVVMPDDGGSVFLKYYLPRGLHERLKYLFRETRAGVEWRNLHRLEALGVPAPRALAWGERRGVGGWRQGFLVTESLAAAPTLLHWSESHAASPALARLRRSLAECLARLHDAGLVHRDLHGRNVLVRDPEGQPGPCLIDFNEMGPARDEQEFIDDLARLNGFVEASRWQRARFLDDYLAARGIARGERRQWLRQVDRATRALWDYYLGRGRDYRRY